MKCITIITAGLLSAAPVSLQAQSQQNETAFILTAVVDSIAPASPLPVMNLNISEVAEKKKAFRRSVSVALPLIALGAYSSFSTHPINKFEILEERNEHFAHFSTGIDNVLQFSPLLLAGIAHLSGFEGKNNTWNQVGILLKSELLLNAIVFPVKKYSHVLRPDNSRYNSFPSGHTAQAFLLAEMLRHEYGKDHPWLAIGGYAAATGVGVLRILNNKHWVSDVLAGAGFGILSVNLVYLTHRGAWPFKNKQVQLTPAYTGNGAGFYFSYQFGR